MRSITEPPGGHRPAFGQRLRKRLARTALGAALVGTGVFGYAAAAHADVVGSLGTFGDSIPIDVPAFRGLQPSLALAYDSSTGNSSTGVGWTLQGIGRIERAAPGRGAPLYNDADIFVLDGVADGDELVACRSGSVSPSCTSGGNYSTRSESYAKITLTGSGAASQWTFVKKDGTQSIYAPVASVAANTVYKWGLAQVVDTKGNTVTYNWDSSQPDLLRSISYNGTVIDFWYGARTDTESKAVGGGYPLASISTRITTIDIGVGGARLRAYKLGYSTSPTTGRSLLTSVQMFGSDATLDSSGTITAGSAMPAVTATYRSPQASFGSPETVGLRPFMDPWIPPPNQPYATPPTVTSPTGSTKPLDVNGDGKMDFVQYHLDRTGTVRGSENYSLRLRISNGTTLVEGAAIGVKKDAIFLPQDVDGDGRSDIVVLAPASRDDPNERLSVLHSDGTSFSQVSNVALAAVADRSWFGMDVNGDGKADLVSLSKSGNGFTGYSWTRTVYLSNGTGFAAGAVDTWKTDKNEARLFPTDVNGDGKIDVVVLEALTQNALGFPVTSGRWNRRILMSNGQRFSETNVDSSMNFGSSDTFLTADVNGDGKGDLIRLAQPSVGGGSWKREVYLSTGSSFAKGSTTDVAQGDYLAADFDGDGRSDFVELKRNGRGYLYDFTVYRSTGTDFSPVGAAGTVGTSPAPGRDGTGSGPSEFFATDINGDGISDLVRIFQAVRTDRALTLSIHPVKGGFQDLLATRTTGQGGTTTVSYTPSSAWANVNNPPVRPTVDAVSVNDGRGQATTTTYSYTGGLFDWTERRFLSFRSQTERRPCLPNEDTACPSTERWFRQDLNAARMIDKVLVRSGSGKLLEATFNDYTTNGPTLPWTALRTGTWTYTYDANSTGVGDRSDDCNVTPCKRRYLSRTYNDYGEITQETDYGDYDVAGDEVMTDTVYVPNTAKYIVDRPASAKRYKGTVPTGKPLNETVITYDGASTSTQAPTEGFPTQVSQRVADDKVVVTRTEFDRFGNKTIETNALGAKIRTTYDAKYNIFPTSVTNPLDQTTSTEWNVACAQPTRSVGVNGQATTFTYDTFCRLESKSSPGGKFEKHKWMNLGDATAQYEETTAPGADDNGPMWSRRYFDGLSRDWRTVRKGPDAATGDISVDTTFNARGAVRTTTAPYYRVADQPKPATATTTFDYDALDRQTRVTHPDSSFTSRRYGLWSVTETDELGREKTDRLNAFANRISHDEFIGGQLQRTTYAYDAWQNLVSTTDPKGNVSTQTFDPLGHVTQTADVNWGTTTYDYDAAGRVTATTDAKGQKTAIGYDLLGRKTSQTANAGTPQAVTVTWAYDEARNNVANVGNLTTVTDTAGTKTLDYDAAGRVVKTTRTIDATAYTFTFGFDAGDRALWTTYPDGDTLGTPSSPLRYDSAGLLRTIPGYVDSATYTADGKVKQINNRNGTVTTRTYSAQRGWLDSIRTQSGTSAIQDLTYGRDAKGLVSKVTSPANAESWDYTRDELDRVTRARNATNPDTSSVNMGYDAIGNITSNSRRGTYAYDSAKKHAVTSDGLGTYTYDAAGLMTSGAGRTITWNGNNRLATVTRGGTTTTMTYDADGNRIQQRDGTRTRRYLDDYEIDGTTVTKYISLAGTLVARKENATTTWIHTDQLGSINVETDASGRQVHRRTYMPYGEVIPTGDTLAGESRGFTGQREDASGLVYLRARYYDPALGRFISPDPVIDGPNTIGLNRYAYTANNPIDRTDVGGLSSMVSLDVNGSADGMGGGGGGHDSSQPGVKTQAPRDHLTSGSYVTTKDYSLQSTSTYPSGPPMETASPGEWLFPEGMPKDLNSYDTVIVNGIMGDAKTIQTYANERKVAAFFNPSNGFLADLREVGVQKVFGRYAEDPLAEQFAAGMKNVNHPMTIEAHSQGAAIVANAITRYGLSAEGNTFHLKSPAIDYLAARNIVQGRGGILDYDMPNGDVALLYNPEAAVRGMLKSLAKLPGEVRDTITRNSLGIPPPPPPPSCSMVCVHSHNGLGEGFGGK